MIPKITVVKLASIAIPRASMTCTKYALLGMIPENCVNTDRRDIKMNGFRARLRVISLNLSIIPGGG